MNSLCYTDKLVAAIGSFNVDRDDHVRRSSSSTALNSNGGGDVVRELALDSAGDLLLNPVPILSAFGRHGEVLRPTQRQHVSGGRRFLECDLASSRRPVVEAVVEARVQYNVLISIIVQAK